MNALVEQYLRSQLESVEYRLTLATNHVTNVKEQLTAAKADLAELQAEADALRSALPAEPEVEAEPEADSK